MCRVGLDVVDPRVILDLSNLLLKLVLLIQRLIDRPRQLGRRREDSIAEGCLVENRRLSCLDLKDCRIVGQAVLHQKF